MNLNVQTTEKGEFMYIWNIKGFQRWSPDSPVIKITSPSFEIEYLKGMKWNIELNKSFKYTYCCEIKSCSEIPEPIPINYQYEVTTAAGVILKTSEVLSHTFSRNYSSIFYKLFDMVDELEEVCLRCRIISCKTTSMITSSSSVVGLENKTDIVMNNNIFKWPLNFSGCNEWTAVEKVTVENIAIDVKFEYIEDALNIELLPKIVDNKFHTLQFRVDLMDENSQFVTCEYRKFEFNNTIGVYKSPRFLTEKQLRKANCFITRKLNIKGFFKYRFNSLVTEIKSFKGDSRTVNHAALTQNEYEADDMLCLLQHLRDMLNEKTYSDVELRADNEVFFAHKCLLASRSPVFKAMFDQGMLESQTNIVHMHDVEAKMMRYFLEYIYTGTLTDLNGEIALKLLVVADKYEVSNLTERCSALLKSVLSLDNVLNVLLVADRVNQEQLKLSSVEHILENLTQVTSLPVWPQWLKANPKLASEIFLKLSQNFDSISICNKEGLAHAVEKGLTLKENSAKENLNLDATHLAVETAEQNSSISTAASSLRSASAAPPVRGNQNPNVLAEAKTTVEKPDSSLQYGNQNSAAFVDASSENKSETFDFISTASSPKRDLKEDKQVEGEIGKGPP